MHLNLLAKSLDIRIRGLTIEKGLPLTLSISVCWADAFCVCAAIGLSIALVALLRYSTLAESDIYQQSK